MVFAVEGEAMKNRENMRLRFMMLVVLVLATAVSSPKAQTETGVYVIDTSAATRRGPLFSITASRCELQCSWTECVLSIADSLSVSAVVVDSLSDTLYTFGTRRLSPGEYKLTWNFSDREVDSLPFVLWLEVEARYSPLSLSSRYFARYPFCALE